MQFSDGIRIETSGPLRMIELHDGWYVVGQGMLIPVSNREEGNRIIAEMKKED